jgi:TPR repeat protein
MKIIFDTGVRRAFSCLLAVTFLSGTFFGQCRAESAHEIAVRFMTFQCYEEAHLALLRAVKEEPNNAEIHYELAKCLQHMGYSMRAIKECQICLKLKPDEYVVQECHQQIDAWQKETIDRSVSFRGPAFRAWFIPQFVEQIWNKDLILSGPQKYLSNLDFWFKDYYRDHTYHSWDENPRPEWVHELEKKQANNKVFGVNVHFVSARLFNTPYKDIEPWHSIFLRDFHKRWEDCAKKNSLSGECELYIFISKDGCFMPVVAINSGNKLLEDKLINVIHSFDHSDFLESNKGKPYVYKAQIGCGMMPGSAGHWWAFTSDEDVKMVMVKLGTAFKVDSNSKKNKFGKVSVTNLPASAPSKMLEPQFLPKPQKQDQSVINKVKSAIKSKDYTESLDLLWPLGERDISEACLLLAKLYSNASVMGASPRMAALWWKKAARAGYAEAQYRLGSIYEWGNGNISGGKADAVEWYTRGAKNGSVDCMVKLGVLNEFGDGMPKSLGQALHWYELAASKGSENAKTALIKRLQNLKHANKYNEAKL